MEGGHVRIMLPTEAVEAAFYHIADNVKMTVYLQ
jgi:hypothetical protein